MIESPAASDRANIPEWTPVRIGEWWPRLKVRGFPRPRAESIAE